MLRYFFELPPALDVRNETSCEELFRTENLQEVSFLSVKSDHGESQGTSFSIDYRSAVEHDEAKAIIEHKSSILRLYDLVVIEELGLGYFLSLVEDLSSIVPVLRIDISSPNTKLIQPALLFTVPAHYG